MAMSETAFRRELYVEHLEEASYLYETRVAWLVDEEVGWLDLERLDDSLEAHLDALMVGGPLALSVCISALPDADAGMLHAIVRVFCRHRSIENLSRLWAGFDFDDTEKVAAVADALKWEAPPEWFPHFLAALTPSRAEMFPILAPSVAYHGMDAGPAFLRLLGCANEQQLPILIQAAPTAVKDHGLLSQRLPTYLAHTNKEIAGEAASALMKMGCSPLVVDQFSVIADKLPHIVALAGTGRHLELVLQRARSGLADAPCLISLGLAGDLQAVPFLVNYLKHPDYALMAALSLHLITGADLYQTEHVPEDIDEDDLFENEIEPFREGKLPTNVDDKPYGSEIERITTDQQLWLRWLENNKSGFSPNMRYRNGKLYSPMELVVNLVSNQLPTFLRRLVYQELVVRYGLDIPFEPDDLVHRQKKQLNAIHKWVKLNSTRFEHGAWYQGGASAG